MFTGIVQNKAPIAWIEQSPSFTRYAITLPSTLLNNLVIGASVSVNGICQTVVAIEGNQITFEAIKETLDCTSLKYWNKGDLVNVERSLKMGDEIGGHLLSGHIIGTGTIVDLQYPTTEQAIVKIQCNPDWMKYIFPKGFIALNGVSLTVGETSQNGNFTVNLIPETRKITTFGEAKIGDHINIEIDSQTQTIVNTVESYLKERNNG